MRALTRYTLTHITLTKPRLSHHSTFDVHIIRFAPSFYTFTSSLTHSLPSLPHLLHAFSCPPALPDLDHRFNPAYDKKTGYLTKSILCMPILEPATNRVVGVIQVINKFASGNDDEAGGIFAGDSDSVSEGEGGASTRVSDQTPRVSGGGGGEGGAGGAPFSEQKEGQQGEEDDGNPNAGERHKLVVFTTHDEELLGAVCDEMGSVINVATLEAQHAMAKEQSRTDKNLHSMLSNFQDVTDNVWHEDVKEERRRNRPASVMHQPGSIPIMRWPSHCEDDYDKRVSVLQDWGFDIWSHKFDKLLNYVQDVFHEHGLLIRYVCVCVCVWTSLPSTSLSPTPIIHPYIPAPSCFPPTAPFHLGALTPHSPFHSVPPSLPVALPLPSSCPLRSRSSA